VCDAGYFKDIFYRTAQSRELYNPPTGDGAHPIKLVDSPTLSPTGGVKSSYTYPDRVYAILSYRKLLQ